MKKRNMSICLITLMSLLFVGCGADKKTNETKIDVKNLEKKGAVKASIIPQVEKKVLISEEKKKRGPFKYTADTTVAQLLWHYSTVEKKIKEFEGKVYSKDLKLKLYKASKGSLYFVSLANHNNISVYSTNYASRPLASSFKDIKNGQIVQLNSPSKNSKFINSEKHRPVNLHTQKALKNRKFYIDKTETFMMTNGVMMDFFIVNNTIANIEKSIGYLYGKPLAYNAQVFKLPHWKLNYECIKLDNGTLASFGRNKLLNYNSNAKKGCKEPNMFPVGLSVENNTNPSLKGIGYKFSELKNF